MSYLNRLNEMASGINAQAGGGMHSHPLGQFAGVITELKVKTTNTGKRIFEVWGKTEHGVVPPYSIWDIDEETVAIASQDDHKLQQLISSMAKTKSIFVSAGIASEDQVSSWGWNDQTTPAVVQNLSKLQGRPVTWAIHPSKKEEGKRISFINAPARQASPHTPAPTPAPVQQQFAPPPVASTPSPVSLADAVAHPPLGATPAAIPEPPQFPYAGLNNSQAPGTGVNLDDVPF